MTSLQHQLIRIIFIINEKLRNNKNKILLLIINIRSKIILIKQLRFIDFNNVRIIINEDSRMKLIGFRFLSQSKPK